MCVCVSNLNRAVTERHFARLLLHESDSYIVSIIIIIVIVVINAVNLIVVRRIIVGIATAADICQHHQQHLIT